MQKAPVGAFCIPFELHLFSGPTMLLQKEASKHRFDCSLLCSSTIWPASCEKGPSDISNSIDQDQPLCDVENYYTQSNDLHSKENKSHWCDECQKVQTLIRRRVRDAAAGLGLHFLHMSKGPFSHDAGHMVMKWLQISATNIEDKIKVIISVGSPLLGIDYFSLIMTLR